MGTAPRRVVGLGPLETIVNVGWGRSYVITVQMSGTTQISGAGHDLPPKELNLLCSVAGVGAINPANDPPIGIPALGAVPPFEPPSEDVPPDLLKKYVMYNLNPHRESGSINGSAGADMYIVRVAPESENSVILPVIIPNPFASEGEAEAWIDQFRLDYPGWAGVPFVIVFIPGGGDTCTTSLLEFGTITINGPQVERFNPTADVIIITCTCNTNQTAAYTCTTPTDQKDELVGQVPTGGEDTMFVSPSVTFTIDKRTMKITSSSNPVDP